MREKARAISDAGKPDGGFATVVRRTVGGQDQLVVVCHECPEIKTIDVGVAMEVALSLFVRDHRESDHR